MKRFLVEGDEVAVPDWVVDLESFRRWTDEDVFPERGCVSFLRGEVWVDLSREDLITHGSVRSAITSGLLPLMKAGRLGRYFTRGAYFTNTTAGLSHSPDGMFVSASALERGHIRIAEGEDELLGTPDLVLEVVSHSSVRKDTVVLRAAYAAAGIPEYWLVDARRGGLSFALLVLKGGSYRAARKRDDWCFSPVFGRWFRLREEAGDDGFATYTLEARDDRP